MGKNNDGSKEKILQAINKLNDTNPQHQIVKKRLQARLETLEIAKPQQRKDKKEKASTPLQSSTLNEKTYSEGQSSLHGEQQQRPQQFYDRKSMNLWTIDDSLKKAHRIIDRRQKFIKKQRTALDRDLASSKKAEEAITLLKQQIVYKYDAVSDGLAKLKQRQMGDITAMKDQIKCISRQNEENAESERTARRIVTTLTQNQVTPISSVIGEFIVGIVRFFLYAIAELRDLIFHKGKNSSINVVQK